MRSKNAEKKGRGVLPRLRFPGYSKPWVPTTLGIKGEFYRGLTYASSDVSDEGTLVVRSSNIQEGKLDLQSDLVFVNKTVPDEIVLRANDIAICMSNGSKKLVGKSAYFDGSHNGRITIGAFCSIYRSSTPLTRYIFETDEYAAFVGVAIGGGNINNLKNSDLEAFNVGLPSHEDEQEKIVSCLSSIDACVDAETRKLDALKAHKQSLIRLLFPAESERMPRLRFPGFDGKWKLQRLDSTIVAVTPPAKLQTAQYMQQGAYPIIDQSPQPIAAWTDDAGGLIAGPFPLIVFGDHTCVLKLAESPFVQGADGIKIFHVEKDVSTAFLFQCLQVNPVLMLDYRRHFSQLKEKMVSFPEDPKEQSRIVDLLASLDALVRAQVEMIGALAQHKKGLMQGLFPAMDAGAA